MTDKGILRPRDIDRILNRLLGVSGSDTIDLAFVEPLVLLLDNLSRRAEPAVFEHYCTLYSPIILRAVRDKPGASFGSDALSRLPSLIARIRELSPELVTADIDARLGGIHERLVFYEQLLEGREPEEYARLQKLSRADASEFTTVLSGREFGLERDFGRIVTARGRIDITGEWSMLRRFEPIIALEGRTLRPKDPFDEQIGMAVTCAEEHFGSRLKIGEIARLPREYRFALSSPGSSSSLQTRFTGGSAGLAFGLLSLAALDALALRRERRLIRANVAFTGTIDRDGSVHAVDEDMLAAKVRAVFYSACASFAVPRNNLPAAAAHLDDLKKQYPKRSLELVPVGHVLEAYDDERIMERRTLPPANVTLAKAKRRKKHFAVALSGLVTAATLLVLLPPRLAREIVAYRFENSRIHFANKYGYEFGGYDFGYRVLDVPAKGPTHDDPDNTASKAYEFFAVDVNGDARNELLVASVESDSTETNPCGKLHVHLFASDGDLVMQTSWLDSLVHSGDDGRNAFRKFYYCHGELLDLDGDGKKSHFAFSMTDRDSYPSVIGTVSLSDGSIESFAHVGYIPHFVAGDFDKDGATEIVAGGTSNGLGCAVAAVLDPKHMQGSSPDVFRYRFENLDGDVAKYYIRMPRSLLCSAREMKIDKPEIRRINLDEQRRIELAVEEGGCSTKYTFDGAWRCVGVAPHSSYQLQYEILRKAYKFPDLGSHLDELRNKVEYWTGSSWSREPSVNESYLKIASGGSAAR